MKILIQNMVSEVQIWRRPSEELFLICQMIYWGYCKKLARIIRIPILIKIQPSKPAGMPTDWT
jgi:hypothetical protein